MSLSNLKKSMKNVFAAGGSHSAGLDVDNAKDYVSAMTDVLQTSSTQQQLALQKVTHLSKSLSKMETKLARLSQVEAQNNDLNRRVSTLETALSEKTETARELDQQLSVTRRQLKIAQDELLSLRAEASGSKHQSDETQERLKAKTQESESLSAKLTSLEQAQADLSARNRTLEDALAQSQNELSAQRRDATEFAQKFDMLERSEARLRHEHDKVCVELNAANTELEQIRADYIDSQARLETMKFETRAAQAQFSDQLRRRDEENLSQKNRISHLEAQMRIKDSAKQQAEREITEVQHTLHLATLRAEEAEKRTREISREAEASASNVMSSQADYDALNARFLGALDDIEALRKLNQIQKSKLMQYAAVDNMPALAPKTAPAQPAPKQASPMAQNVEPAKNIRILRQIKN